MCAKVKETWDSLDIYVSNARASLATLLGAQAQDIAITAGTSSGIAAVAAGRMEPHPGSSRASRFRVSMSPVDAARMPTDRLRGVSGAAPH